MLIKKLESGSIRIELNPLEALSFGLVPDSRGETCLRTVKQAILQLMAEIRLTAGVGAGFKNFGVKLYFKESGRCVLIVEPDTPTSHSPKSGTIILSFQDADSMIDLAIKLGAVSPLPESSLFHDDEYHLVIYSREPCPRLVSLLSEHGDYRFSNDFAVALLLEHSSPLIPHRAIETVLHYFNPL